MSKRLTKCGLEKYITASYNYPQTNKPSEGETINFCEKEEAVMVNIEDIKKNYQNSAEASRSSRSFTALTELLIRKMTLSLAVTQVALPRNLVSNIYKCDETDDTATWDVTNVTAGTLRTLTVARTNTSDIAYNPHSERISICDNGQGDLIEYDLDDIITGPTTTQIRTLDVQGFTADIEGLDDVVFNLQEGGYEFMACHESGASVAGYFNFDTVTGGMFGTADSNITVRQTLQVDGTAGSNDNSEGVANNNYDQSFSVGREGASSDRVIYFVASRPTDRDTDYIQTDPELVVTEPFDAQANLLPITNDISSIAYHTGTGNYLVLSQTGARLYQIDLEGDSVVAELDISSFGFNQAEGICFYGDDLIICGEPDEFMVCPYVV